MPITYALFMNNANSTHEVTAYKHVLEGVSNYLANGTAPFEQMDDLTAKTFAYGINRCVIGCGFETTASKLLGVSDGLSLFGVLKEIVVECSSALARIEDLDLAFWVDVNIDA